MSSIQRSKCASIIHSCAAAAAAGNLVPVPGVGAVADLSAITTMTVKLARVFDQEISSSVARSLAIAALARHAAKSVIKEIVKWIPIIGQIAGPAISAATIEAAGWDLANDFARKANVRKSI